jgi:hypothetical protein
LKELDELKKSSRHYQSQAKANSYYTRKYDYSSSSSNKDTIFSNPSKKMIAAGASVFILFFSY